MILEYRKVKGPTGANCRSRTCANSNSIAKGDYGLKTIFGWYCKDCAPKMMNRLFEDLIRVAGQMDYNGHAQVDPIYYYNINGKILKE